MLELGGFPRWSDPSDNDSVLSQLPLSPAYAFFYKKSRTESLEVPLFLARFPECLSTRLATRMELAAL